MIGHSTHFAATSPPSNFTQLPKSPPITTKYLNYKHNPLKMQLFFSNFFHPKSAFFLIKQRFFKTKQVFVSFLCRPMAHVHKLWQNKKAKAQPIVLCSLFGQKGE
jgi:hypothetical protein